MELHGDLFLNWDHRIIIDYMCQKDVKILRENVSQCLDFHWWRCYYPTCSFRYHLAYTSAFIHFDTIHSGTNAFDYKLECGSECRTSVSHLRCSLWPDQPASPKWFQLAQGWGWRFSTQFEFDYLVSLYVMEIYRC